MRLLHTVRLLMALTVQHFRKGYTICAHLHSDLMQES